MLKTTLLDTNWLGRPRSIAAVLLESNGHIALLDPGPASALPALRSQLAGHGISVADLNAVLLTHIHLDHAGTTGQLVRENPQLAVYVHQLGMPHMADPSKLLASADRLWPGQLGVLFGETLPVPPGNLRVLAGGETLELGARRMHVLYTPGHAAHHVTYFDPAESTAFVGDTAGFYLTGLPYPIPVAPPPDIDLEIWNASLDAIAELQPSRLLLTHFGYAENPAALIKEYRESLRRWSAVAAELLRAQSDEHLAMAAFIAATKAEIEQRLAPADAEHCLFNVGLNLSWLGLARYHRKRAKAAAAAAPQDPQAADTAR